MPDFLRDPEVAAIAGVLAREAWKWLAVAVELYAQYRAAKAEADGQKTWDDLFWPRVLAALNKHRAAVVRAGRDK